MKKKIAALGAIILAVIAVYIFYQDSLPPRTPHKVARLISGLSIPDDSRVIEFKDQWNDLNGNGFSFIVIQLDDKSFNKIYQEARESDYKALPITEGVYGPLKDISKKKVAGIYKVNFDDEATKSFNAAMLSNDDRRILVYFSVN